MCTGNHRWQECPTRSGTPRSGSHDGVSLGSSHGSAGIRGKWNGVGVALELCPVHVCGGGGGQERHSQHALDVLTPTHTCVTEVERYITILSHLHGTHSHCSKS